MELFNNSLRLLLFGVATIEQKTSFSIFDFFSEYSLLPILATTKLIMVKKGQAVFACPFVAYALAYWIVMNVQEQLNIRVKIICCLIEFVIRILCHTEDEVFSQIHKHITTKIELFYVIIA